ncbi:hypothetical protein FOZ61_006018, partial [Perkinsus olseni]
LTLEEARDASLYHEGRASHAAAGPPDAANKKAPQQGRGHEGGQGRRRAPEARDETPGQAGSGTKDSDPGRAPPKARCSYCTAMKLRGADKHDDANCWKNPANAHLVPEWYRQRRAAKPADKASKEQAAASGSGSPPTEGTFMVMSGHEGTPGTSLRVVEASMEGPSGTTRSLELLIDTGSDVTLMSSSLAAILGAKVHPLTIYIEPPRGESAFVCITPERLCRVKGGHIETEAVAGTWKPSEITTNDEADLKRTTEHSTVTKYIRGILTRRAHDVHVSGVNLLRLKELVHCKQMLEATVDLSDQQDALNTTDDDEMPLHNGHDVVEWLVRDLHPTPAVGGKPLKDGMTFIRAREPFDRGFFAAPCGVVSSGGGELAVSLRSALVERRHGSKVHVMAGAGLIEGSVPKDEWDEIRLKMRQFVGTLSDGVRPALKEPMEFPNFNTFWCAVFVDELVRLGIKHFVVCPGSRSTPLTIAVTQHPQATHVVHTDERGAAFYALGYAKATGLPAPVIVTSGSAVANLLPAVTEAHESRVPMLLLTADRPSELRDTGSNQTMNQTDIFKPYALWTRDFAPPCESAPIRSLLSDVDYAVGECLQQNGVVHMNMQFRENLAPEGGAVRGGQYGEVSAFRVPEDSRFTRWQLRSTEPLTRVARPARRAIEDDAVKELISSGTVVLVVGALSSPMDAAAVDAMAEALQCLVLADAVSGCRRECLPSLCLSSQAVLDMLQLSRPTVIRLGGALISKQVQAWMSSKMGPVKEHIRVMDVPRRHDVDWNGTIVVDATCAEFARMVDDLTLDPAVLRTNRSLRDRIHAISSRAEKRIQAELGEECTAVGYAVGLGRATNLLIGDVAAIHDLNSLVQLANYLNGGGIVGDVKIPPVKIVVSNNNGGSMFKFVPIGKYAEDVAYNENFRTPNAQVAFAGAAKMLGLEGSKKVDDLAGMIESLDHSGLTEIVSGGADTGILPSYRVWREDLSPVYHSLDFWISSSRQRWLNCAGAQVPKTSQDEDVALRRRITAAVGEVVEESLRLHPGVKLRQAATVWVSSPEALFVSSVSSEAVVLSYSDWLACEELTAKYDILSISLPGHGSSQASEGSTLFDYGMSATIANLRGLVKDLINNKPVTVCGYSQGGRVALEWARRAPGDITRLIVIAASTAVGGPAIRERRWRSDCAWAEKLESPNLDLGLFLTKWYGSGSVFADLPTRRPEEFFGQWLPSRVGDANPSGWAKSMLAMSQAWSVDCSEVPVDRFIAGALDSKYSNMKVSLAIESDRVILPDVGHSLLWEVDCETLIHAAKL